MVTKRIAASAGMLMTITLTAAAGTAVAGCAPLSARAAAASAGAKPPTNYLYASIGDFDATVKPLIDRPDIAGVQLVVPWKALERKKDQYDFSSIDQALTYLQARHK